MSQIAPLIDALKKHDAEEMRLEVGERIFLMKAGVRQDVGREPLQGLTLERMAVGVLGTDGVKAVAASPRTVTMTRDDENYQVSFRSSSGAIAIRIRRTERARPEPAPEPKPPGAPKPGFPGSPPVETPTASAPAAVSPAGPRSSPAQSELDEILHLMVAEDASDLHLSAGVVPVLRIHGEMRFLTGRGSYSSERIEKLMRTIMREDDRTRFGEMRDVDLAYEIPGLSRFRVNVFEDRNGVGTVIRRIPVRIATAEELGLPQAVLDLCYLSKGLVVATGPTGSGKSTTLAAMVDYINSHRTDHIITIEDPIEFIHQNRKCLVNQREVGRHTQSFKNALRAALREDPDIVLVGEMRDLETIALAIETAETGHLVFGTLHTTTAVSTVDRIIDQFPPDRQAQIRVMLSESLKGVVAQVLCKRIGGGRVAALEILLGNQAIASLVREGKTFQIPSVMQTSKRQGMLTMNDSLLTHVKEKRVEPKEAWIKATDKTGLLNMFKGASLPTSFTEG